MEGNKNIGYYYPGPDNYIYPLFDNRYLRKVHFYQGDISSIDEILKFVTKNKIDVIYSTDQKFLATLEKSEKLEEVFKNVYKSKEI